MAGYKREGSGLWPRLCPPDMALPYGKAVACGQGGGGGAQFM